MAIPTELANLPEPTLIEQISFEARLTLFRTRAVELFAAAGIEYDVEQIEADPLQVILQVVTYADSLLRQRVNEAIRANLLAYATGTDLDHLAQFYDVIRNSGETDERLRTRIILTIRGRSTGGTEPRYRSVALASSPRVLDAAVYTVGKDPTVRVAVFSTDNSGVADQALLDIVNAALQDPAVRMVNDVIVVAAASRVATPITANVWLLPETGSTILDQMSAALTAAWTEQIVLGRDVTRSWIIAKLSLDGVQKIEIVAPVADVIVPPFQAAALGTITLNNMGRAY